MSATGICSSYIVFIQIFWLFPRSRLSNLCPSPISIAEHAAELWPYSSCSGMWCLSAMEVQSDICHQCVLWYHWGWTEPLRHLKTVPWKNTDWSSQLQLFKKTGEVLHLDRLVVSWYDWKVLFMCCLIVQPSSAVISEEFAPSVSNQAECWLRIGCQWVQINTVYELLLRMHLLRLVLLSGCPWLLENLCCGGENCLCRTYSTFLF